MQLKRYIVLIGLPLVGVTTAARLAASVLSLQHVHMEHLMRDVDPEQVELDQPVLDYALLGKIPGYDGTAVQMAKGQLETMFFGGAVLDGVPSNLHQAVLLEDYLSKKNYGITTCARLKMESAITALDNYIVVRRHLLQLCEQELDGRN